MRLVVDGSVRFVEDGSSEPDEDTAGAVESVVDAKRDGDGEGSSAQLRVEVQRRSRATQITESS